MSRADELADAWVAFWNGDLGRAGTLLTDDFRIHFGGGDEAALAGDEVRGPAAMSAYVEDFRKQREGPRFSLDEPPIAGDRGFVMRWSVRRPGVHRGGIDLLHVTGDRIAEVWSVTGERAFAA
ncbi:hypothetical protein GCM10010168_09790 [Actinoplanes ianthinogenes]|uniref:SnoaL-like domain-containing protein n=1 Tax=Actinoplanes ianthinogenes TaxID=122358 RepID=A0ABM7LY22_9ACTN|nr:nuclear transport factor 2 family protein [Actinoplanes ianthinogenes]BCJ44166.1 hypothetical protein Aiant_48230 [Actinoplanes ianthinogenes]GGQ96198.1 hypothetical protein GCM10010168_09790 [Actinoplanes ianthinogenes]